MNAPELSTKSLKIWQQNLNKSFHATSHLLHLAHSNDYDFLTIQEPYIDHLCNTRALHRWHVIYPTEKASSDVQSRSIILVNAKLDTNSWRKIDFPSRDEIRGSFGMFTIANIYNDCKPNDTILRVHRFLDTNKPQLLPNESHHLLICGDFNRHHPLWEDDANYRLCSAANIRTASPIIDLISNLNLVQILPKGLYTLELKSNRQIRTRPDNTFCTSHTEPHLTKCTVEYNDRGPGADHFLIITHFDIPLNVTSPKISRNFRATDWEEFQAELERQLQIHQIPAQISSTTMLNNAVSSLTTASQATIQQTVPLNRPVPGSKRWWTKDLTKQRKMLHKLQRDSHRFRYIEDHPVHEACRRTRNDYNNLIDREKKSHWNEWLENVIVKDIWAAGKYIDQPYGDGGRSRIPTLKQTMPDDTIRIFDTNTEKAHYLADIFFPTPPDPNGDTRETDGFEYPEPVTTFKRPSPEQVMRALSRLSPYKAPGPDGIPNIVLQKNADLLVKPLVNIFKACFTLGSYPKKWKESNTVVVRKPGRPDYSDPNAFRPIALLNTMAKILSATVAESLTYISEKYELLPNNQFRGRPGRTTTDALHLLTHTIKNAWRAGQVVSVLFLDIEGAFRNAATHRLLHNLRSKVIPREYVNFISSMLNERKTKLLFDDYTSDTRTLNHGIGQGCPLSMLLYLRLFYNADLVTVPQNKSEASSAFVDDGTLLARGKNFIETTAILKDMMERPKGALLWARAHSSKFAYKKFYLVHFARKKTPDPENPHRLIALLPRPPLYIENTCIEPRKKAKLLEVWLDEELRWHEQSGKTIAKATKWALAFKRITRTNGGLSPRATRLLHQTVLLPKMLYAADVWITPPHLQPSSRGQNGSVQVIKRITTIQRIALTAITGAMRTTATDAMAVHAYTLPMNLQVHKHCFKATLRLASLPDTHPLSPHIRRSAKQYVAKARSALHEVFYTYPTANPRLHTIECIPPISDAPWTTPALDTYIAETRDAAIDSELAWSNETDIAIYTDGSGHND